MDGLEEKGYSTEQLAEVARMIDAENSDLYDVLAYIAFNRPPISRSERVQRNLDRILAGRDYREREFLNFVLDHYVQQGVGELDEEKLPKLISLKYHALSDAVTQLGSAGQIRNVFVQFQRELYQETGEQPSG